MWIPRIRYDNTITRPPVLSSAVGSGAGGTIPAGTYRYVVTAINVLGESIASNEIAVVLAGTTSSVALAWVAVPGATGYRVYRGPAGGAVGVYDTYYVLGNVLAYTNTALAGTAGAPPAVAPYRILTLTHPQLPWTQPSKRIGGKDESASGVIASYEIRTDRKAIVTLRFEDTQYDALVSMFEFVQMGAPFYFAFDATRVPLYEYFVRCEDPSPGDDIEPAREDYLPMWNQKMTIRTVAGDRIAVPFYG